jgi:hypothetical protein
VLEAARRVVREIRRSGSMVHGLPASARVGSMRARPDPLVRPRVQRVYEPGPAESPMRQAPLCDCHGHSNLVTEGEAA